MSTTIPARWRTLVLASALAGVVLLAFGYLAVDDDEDPAVVPLVLVLVLSAAIGLALWRAFGDRTGEAAAGPALGIGIASVVGGLFYWTGLVFFLAPVGIALGIAAERDRKGRIGLALSVAGLAFAVVWGLFDAVL